VWTVFLVFAAAFGAAIGAQALIVIAIVVRHVAQGENVQDLAQDLPVMLATPWAFIGLLIPSQLAMGGTALLAAWLSPRPARERLGLAWPNLPGWAVAVVVVSSLAPLALGVLGAHLLAQVLPPDPSAAKMYEQMTWGAAAPLILCVALAPGLMEEILFRGYMQRRLLERWSPWWAIGATSLLFSLMHIMPHQVLATVPLGLWFGVIAWRTGSIWPTILAHAFVNGAWNVLQVGQRLMEWPEAASNAAAITGAVVGLACFVIAVRLLRRPVGCGQPS
jgi:membrane protease YdiL (CAAX protease family)